MHWKECDSIRPIGPTTRKISIMRIRTCRPIGRISSKLTCVGRIVERSGSGGGRCIRLVSEVFRRESGRRNCYESEAYYVTLGGTMA